MNKLHLKNGEKVIVSKLGDGKEYPGTIVGRVSEHMWDTYIVQTEGRPFAGLYDFDCIAIMECCLARA